MICKAFIFDFDGVIADTEAAWFHTLLSFVKRHKLNIPLETMEKHIGDGDTKMMQIIADALGSMDKLNSLYPELKEDFAKRTMNLRPREGVHDYLDFADNHGITIACASSSFRPYIENWLTKLNLSDRFNTIVTRSDVDSDKVKPFPDIYLKTLGLLSLKPSEALAFEDSLVGATAAERAGIQCVLVPNQVTQNKTSSLSNVRIDMSTTTPMQLMSDLKINLPKI